MGFERNVEFPDGTKAVEQVFMQEFNPEDQEEAERTKENEKHIYNPEFIPFYLDVVKKFDLTVTEGLLYGFIRFYCANGTGRFYFTNQQLSEIVNCSEVTIERSMKNLKDKSLIKTGYRIKTGGGTIRFINGVSLHQNDILRLHQNDILRLHQNDISNKNKINKNKIKDNKIRNLSFFINNKEEIQKEMQEKYPHKKVKKALDEFISYCEAKEPNYKNYKAAFSRWVGIDQYKRYSKSETEIQAIENDRHIKEWKNRNQTNIDRFEAMKQSNLTFKEMQ